MSQELITYLDERFHAIDERFRETTHQIQDLRQETTQQIQGLRQETSQQIQGLREETTQRFDLIDARFDQVDERFEQVDERFERVEASGRHTNVLLEGLRHEVHLLAEGVYSLSQRLDSHKDEVAHQFEDTRRMIERPYQDLNLRVRALEGWRELKERDPVELVRERILNRKAP